MKNTGPFYEKYRAPVVMNCKKKKEKKVILNGHCTWAKMSNDEYAKKIRQIYLQVYYKWAQKKSAMLDELLTD